MQEYYVREKKQAKWHCQTSALPGVMLKSLSKYLVHIQRSM